MECQALSHVLCFISIFTISAQTAVWAQHAEADSSHQGGDLQSRPPVQLQEVTIVASPYQHESPLSSVTVSPVVIQQTVATDAWDLLRQTAGLEVHEQGQGPGFASDASIRGFSSDHSTDIALWVDGVPVNEPVNGHAEGYDDFSLLFPQLIRNIEVIKGPVSPLYGNFALAGAVNVLTIERADSTTASLSGGSNARLEGTVVTGFDNGATGGVIGFRGIRDDGWRPNSDWSLGQAYARLVRDFSDAVTIDGGIGLYASGWDSPGFLTVDQFDHQQYVTVTNATDGGYKRRAQERLSARVFLTPTTLWRSTIYATQGRWQLFLTIPPEPGSGEGTGSQTEEEDSRYGYGATSALTLALPMTDLTFGVEGRLDHSDYQNWLTTSRIRNMPQTLVSARQVLGAAFLQGETKLSDRLRLRIGGRYDALVTESVPDGSPTVSESKGVFSPKLGVSYDLFSSVAAYANVSKGFRQTDGVITDPSLPFIIAWNYEAGFKFHSDRFAADVAFFRMDVSNEQTFDPVTLSSTSNGASRRQGVDISVDARLTKAISLSTNLTVTDAKYLDLITADGVSLGGSQIYNTSKYVGTAALDLAPPKQRWYVRLCSNVVGPYAPFDEPGVTLPSYALFQLSAGYQLGSILFETGVRNLFDKAYPELRAGGFVDPGQPRAGYLTMKYTL